MTASASWDLHASEKMVATALGRRFLKLLSILGLLGLIPAVFANDVFYPTAKSKGSAPELQKWDAEELKLLQRWNLDPQKQGWFAEGSYVDTKESLAVVRRVMTGRSDLVLVDLISGGLQSLPDIPDRKPLVFRFMKRELDAILPVPIRDDKPAFWTLWELRGRSWAENLQARTKSLDDLVRGHQWLALANKAVRQGEKEGRLWPFGICGSGGSPLVHDVLFGHRGSGCLNPRSRLAVVELHRDDFSSVFQLLNLADLSARPISAPFAFVEGVCIAGRTLVFQGEQGALASQNEKGRVKARAKADLRFSVLIG